MKVFKILISGITATSLMTLFSYLASAAEQENFKEPELLAELERDALPARAKYFDLPAGWATHYSIGIVWAAAYAILWQKTPIKPTVKSGLILGGLSGITGIVIWKEMFNLRPNPPRISFKNFYAQLFFAHLIYGVVATIAGRSSK